VYLISIISKAPCPQVHHVGPPDINIQSSLTSNLATASIGGQANSVNAMYVDDIWSRTADQSRFSLTAVAMNRGGESICNGPLEWTVCPSGEIVFYE